MNKQGFYVRLHPMCNKYYNFYTKDNNEESVKKRILQSIEILQEEGIVPHSDVIKNNYKTENIDSNFVFNGGLREDTSEVNFNNKRFDTPTGYWYDINLDLIIPLKRKIEDA